MEKTIKYCPNTTIIIKSTIPIGYTESIKKKYTNSRILFSPEFLREGKALYDNLYPSRIIVGALEEDIDFAGEFASLLKNNAIKKDIPLLMEQCKTILVQVNPDIDNDIKAELEEETNILP